MTTNAPEHIGWWVIATCTNKWMNESKYTNFLYNGSLKMFVCFSIAWSEANNSLSHKYTNKQLNDICCRSDPVEISVSENKRIKNRILKGKIISPMENFLPFDDKDRFVHWVISMIVNQPWRKMNYNGDIRSKVCHASLLLILYYY